MNQYAALTDNTPVDLGYVPPKREIKNHSDKSELEAAVLREVGELLAVHPLVLFAVRQNSGAAYLTGKGGADVPVWFYKFVRSRTPLRISDYWGLLTDGRPFAVECKRRDWKTPSGQREIEQRDFLLTIRGAGGTACFATCADDVVKMLDTKRK